MGGNLKYKPIGKYAKVQGGYAYKSKDFTDDSGVPVLKIRNVRHRDIDVSEVDKVSEGIARATERFYVKPGDVIISMTGSGVQAPDSIVGRVARYTGPSEKYLINQRVGRLIVKDSNELDPRYLYYFLSQRLVQWKLVSIATGSANQVNISAKQIEGFAMPMRDITEQRAIAHILGTLDDKIELNRKMNETLEAMARAIFKSWFVDFLPVHAKAEGRDTGLPKEVADLFPDSFEDSELGEIPNGWDIGNIGEIAENVRDGIRPEEITPDTPYIGLNHMPRKRIALSEWGYAEEVTSNKFKFRQGNILFGKLRPYFHKVGMAPVSGVCSTDILVVEPKQPIWYGLVLSYLSSDEFVNHVNATTTGTRMPRTNWANMAGYQIALPPHNIAKIFNQTTASMLKDINSNLYQSRTISAIRDALLPKLISGEIRVKDAEKITEVTS